MGEVCRYRGVSTLSVGELEAVLARGAARFADFRAFSPGMAVSAYVTPAVLPEPQAFEGAVLRAVRVQGFLPAKGDPLAAFLAILENGAPIAERGSLSLTVSFTEAGSRPSKRNPDQVEIQLARGDAWFSFSAGRSRVADDAGYRKEFMRRIAEETAVPIRLDEAGAHFFLQHRAAGKLHLTDSGLNGADPAGFQVELQERSPAALVALMKDFLARFSGPKRFDHTWLASTVFDGRAAEAMIEGPEIYEAVQRAGFPAERYFIDATLLLEHLEGLNGLRALCGPGDELYTDLAAFPLDRDNYLNLQVVTTTAGHRLAGESRLPVDLATIGNRLGVELLTVG